MKIQELILRNFKIFESEQKSFSFCDELGNANTVTVIVGANGSGKSSILQAIAMLVGSAVKKSVFPDKLEWPGLNYEFIRNNRTALIAEATVRFTSEEIQATTEYAEELNRMGRNLDLPGGNEEVRIQLDYQNKKVLSFPDRRNLFQFKGYEYALQINGNNLPTNIRRVGSIYWYNEQRTALSISRPIEGSASEGNISITEVELRRILHEWDSFHVKALKPGFVFRDGQRDRFASLNELFSSVFPGKSLVGSEPNPSPDRILEPPLFWLRDANGREYELSNMSGGERAIFPMLIDFAVWEIHNSIILIDEIELHLHPPLQQALARALVKLGKNNQFIITTHSDHVARMFPESNIIRL